MGVISMLFLELKASFSIDEKIEVDRDLSSALRGVWGRVYAAIFVIKRISIVLNVPLRIALIMCFLKRSIRLPSNTIPISFKPGFVNQE